jgi:hypothetical protein
MAFVAIYQCYAERKIEVHVYPNRDELPVDEMIKPIGPPPRFQRGTGAAFAPETDAPLPSVPVQKVIGMKVSKSVDENERQIKSMMRKLVKLGFRDSGNVLSWVVHTLDEQVTAQREFDKTTGET